MEVLSSSCFSYASSKAICTSTSSNGTCVPPDTCGCSENWPGRNCTTCEFSTENHVMSIGTHQTTIGSFLVSAAICSPPCQNGGSCISPDRCVCTQGRTGPDCSQRMSKGHHMMSHMMHLFLAMHVHPLPCSCLQYLMSEWRSLLCSRQVHLQHRVGGAELLHT